jgi:hypothetical protein
MEVGVGPGVHVTVGMSVGNATVEVRVGSAGCVGEGGAAAGGADVQAQRVANRAGIAALRFTKRGAGQGRTYQRAKSS